LYHIDIIYNKLINNLTESEKRKEYISVISGCQGNITDLWHAYFKG